MEVLSLSVEKEWRLGLENGFDRLPTDPHGWRPCKPSLHRVVIALSPKVRSFCLCLAVTAYLLLLAGGILLAMHLDEQRCVVLEEAVPASALEEATLVYEGCAYLRRSDQALYLLAGLDPHQDGRCYVDYATLLLVDDQLETVRCVLLDPDTLLDPMTGESTAIRLSDFLLSAESRAEGMRQLTLAVGRLLYVELDGFLALEQRALALLNDTLGGVDVTMAQDWTELDSAFTAGATVHLNGTQADRLVRGLTELDGATNTARMRRQQLYGIAAAQALRQRMAEDSAFPRLLLDALDGLFLTDLTSGEIADAADRASRYTLLEGDLLPGNHALDEQGAVSLAPDRDSILTLALAWFYRPRQ